ncbi:RNA-directed DNA polymerase, eukaryota [Tanacetum coccineum]
MKIEGGVHGTGMSAKSLKKENSGSFKADIKIGPAVADITEDSYLTRLNQHQRPESPSISELDNLFEILYDESQGGKPSFVCQNVVKSGGSVLDVMEDIIRVGQVMGYSMEGCVKDLENIIGKQGEDNMESKDNFQKSKVKWAVEGDENSKFFHGIINKRRAQLAIRGIFVDGFWETEPALIPKVMDAKFVNDFRPISLIGSVYKVVTKVLAIDYSGHCDLISDTQSAFVAGRQILDGPFILDEILHWCKRKNKKAMFFKVDFAKAYDSVRWDYLLEVLEAFGFGRTWCNWIRGTLTSAKASNLDIMEVLLKSILAIVVSNKEILYAPYLLILIMESLIYHFNQGGILGLSKVIDGFCDLVMRIVTSWFKEIPGVRRVHNLLPSQREYVSPPLTEDVKNKQQKCLSASHCVLNLTFNMRLRGGYNDGDAEQIKDFAWNIGDGKIGGKNDDEFKDLSLVGLGLARLNVLLRLGCLDSLSVDKRCAVIDIVAKDLDTFLAGTLL